MSKNIQQVYTDNPITTNAGTDLMYFGQSPYVAGDDAAMLFSDFVAQIAAGSANQIAYFASTGNKVTGLATANNGVLITDNTGSPSFLANSVTPGYVLTANAGAPPSWQANYGPVGPGTLNHMLRSDGTGWVETTNTVLDASDNLSGLNSVIAGNLSLVGNTLISTNTNGNILFAPNGTGSTCIGLGQFLPNGVPFQVSAGSLMFAGIGVGKYANDAQGCIYGGYKSRSTSIGSFSALSNNDIMCDIRGNGDDGTQFILSSIIRTAVSGSVSTGIVPSQLIFFTTTTSGVLTVGMTLSNAQVLTLAKALPVGSGGLGITTTPSNGQIPIGNGTTYTAATITAGSGISITNGSASITIASTGAASGGFVYTSVSGTSQAAVAGNAYILNNVAATTVTLPASGSSTIGDTIKIKGRSSASWIIQANTSQIIVFDGTSSTTAGTVTSAAGTDSVQLVYVAANEWSVDWAVSSGLVLA